MQSRKLWILVIEDEPDLAEMISDAFAKAGFQVSSCGSAVRALQLIRNQRFDAMIVDLKLEHGTGEQVLTTVRNDVHCPNRHTPAVVTSGHLDHEIVRRLGKLIQGAFVKPYSHAAVVEKVKALCQAGPFAGPQ